MSFPGSNDFDEQDPMSKVTQATMKLTPLILLATMKLTPLILLATMDPKALTNVMLIKSINQSIEFLEVAKKLAAAKLAGREDDTSASSGIPDKV